MSPLALPSAVARKARLSWPGWLARVLGLLATAALLVTLAVLLPDYLAEAAEPGAGRGGRTMDVGLLGLLGFVVALLPAWLGFRWASSRPRVAQARCANCPWSGKVLFQYAFQPGGPSLPPPAEILGDEPAPPGPGVQYESHLEGIPDLDDPVEGRRDRLHRRRLRRAREEEEEQGPNPDFDFKGLRPPQ